MKRVSEEFSWKLSEEFREKKKLFWTEVKKERGEKSGGMRMKREDGATVRECSEFFFIMSDCI